MDTLSQHYKPRVCEFVSANDELLNNSSHYLSVYSESKRQAILNGHTLSPCDDVTLYLLRGMPGQGKTYYCENTIRVEEELNGREVKVISANLVAAEKEAKRQGVELNNQNQNELTEAFFKEREGSDRQALTKELHGKSQHDMDMALFDHCKGDPGDQKPLTIVVDNTNIRSWEMASYLAIALKHGIPKKNMTIVEVDPFDNPGFGEALKKGMEERSIKFVEGSKQWPNIKFERINEAEALRGRLTFPADGCKLAAGIICKALSSTRISPLEPDYMEGRFKSYFESTPSMKPDLLIAEAIEIANSQNKDHENWRAKQVTVKTPLF